MEGKPRTGPPGYDPRNRIIEVCNRTEGDIFCFETKEPLCKEVRRVHDSLDRARHHNIRGEIRVTKGKSGENEYHTCNFRDKDTRTPPHGRKALDGQ